MFTQFELQVGKAPADCELLPRAELAFAAIAENWPAASGEKRALPAWQVSLEFEAATLSVTLRDRQQVVHLTRTVTLRPGACATAADSAAVIVERYLQAIGWQPDRSALPAQSTLLPTPVPPAPIVASQKPVARSLGAVSLGPQSELAGARQRLRWGGALAYRAPPRPFYGELGVALFAPETRALRNDDSRVGSYQVTSLLAHVGLGGCVLAATIEGCVSGGVGGEVFMARVTGNAVQAPTSATALRPYASVGLEVHQPLFGSDWQWFAEVAGFVRGDPPRFVVTGATTQYGVPPRGVRVTLGVAFDYQVMRPSR